MKLNKDFPHKLYLDKRVLVNGIKRNNVNYENHIELKEWIQDLIDSEELEIPSQTPVCCDLQDTTDVGNKTTNDIELSDDSNSVAKLVLSYQNDPLRLNNPTIRFHSGGSTYSTWLGTSEDGTGENGSANDNYVRLPYVTGETRHLAASVNGIEADTTGNIELPNSRPYKVYTALLHQTGTNAPIPEIVENTLGQNIIWTRDNIGAYYGNFDTYIPNNNEVIVFVNGSRDDIVVSAFFDSGEINLLKRQLYVDFQLEEYGYNGIDNFQFVYIEIRVYD